MKIDQIVFYTSDPSVYTASCVEEEIGLSDQAK